MAKMAAGRSMRGGKRVGGGRRGTRGGGIPGPQTKGKPPLSPGNEEENFEMHDAGYEYEEGVAQEESGRNRRYDDVEVYEYELPKDFEDEEIDEEAAFTEEDKHRFGGKVGEGGSEEEGEEEEDSDEFDLNSEEEEEEEEEDGDEGEDEEEYEEEEEEDKERADMNGRQKLAGRRRIEEEDNGAEEEEEEDDDEDDEEEEEEDEDEEEEDEGGYDAEEEEKYRSMIAEVMGRTGSEGEETKADRKRRRKVTPVSEAYPESEFNLNPSTATGGEDGEGGQLSVEELLGSLGGDAIGGGALGALRKRLERQQRGRGAVSAPLPKAIKERIDRKAGYEKTSEDVTKWQPIVKRNRETPTLVLTPQRVVPTLSTAAVADKFTPATEMERQIARLLQENGVGSAQAVEEGEALALNKLTVEEVRARKERLAKMRSLLFRSELRAKRVKKIKSKTYHRLMLKSERRKKTKADPTAEMDPEEAKEEAIKQEFRRAQERMTLKHRNTSKWAKRILQRGLTARSNQEAEGTRAAIAEQLRAHQELTRKIHSASIGREGSSEEDEDEWSDEEGEDGEEGEEGAEGGAGEGEGEGGGRGLVIGSGRAKILAKGKAAALRELEGDAEAEIPKTGLFALPFMARAIEKKRKQAEEEAMAVLRELDREAQRGPSDGDLDGAEGRSEEEEEEEGEGAGAVAGRRTFGMGAEVAANEKAEEEEGGLGEEGTMERGSDSDEEGEASGEEDEDEGDGRTVGSRSSQGQGSGSSRGRRVNSQKGRMGDVGGSSRGKRGGVASGSDATAEVELLEEGNQIGEVGLSAGHGTRTAGPVDVGGGAGREAEAAWEGKGEGEGGRSGAATGAFATGVTTPPVAGGKGGEQGTQGRGAGGAGRGGEGKGNGGGEEQGVQGQGLVLGNNPSLFGDPTGVVSDRRGGPHGGAPLAGGKATAGDRDAAEPKQKRKRGNQPVNGKGSDPSSRLSNPNSRPNPNPNPDPTPKPNPNPNPRPNPSPNPDPGSNSTRAAEPANGAMPSRLRAEEAEDEGGEDGHGAEGTGFDSTGFDSGMGLGSGTEVAEGDPMDPEPGSQRELIRRAFAGDDVEAEFEEAKAAALDEEVPRQEGPVTLPGWGQWTHVQQKKGAPAWIVKEREALARRREAAMGRRQDAKLKHVVISERSDKKAAKYAHGKVPYPFTSREAFERSLRNPIGRDFNTDQSFRDMIRPAVLKSTGNIIDPIAYQPSTYSQGKAGKAGGVSGKKQKPKGQTDKKAKRFKIGKD